ncbi:hypothetical protein K503DRAFT_855354 [Rhizopogon vinicolor AM-OR11-026]|uniref:Uncharacterized protein n=1 Tax=Rhizopogon vinicolor AM-OR11-026 TaxID=1314800 RepID=A0A1B7N6G3_9AGAM|nr:hypothetical protein K503DRAFT_855354 [Rhizopogon vinicolor AM-OR11-026]
MTPEEVIEMVKKGEPKFVGILPRAHSGKTGADRHQIKRRMKYPDAGATPDIIHAAAVNRFSGPGLREELQNPGSMATFRKALTMSQQRARVYFHGISLKLSLRCDVIGEN